MKIFLTGATGYLGLRLAKALSDAGHSLACLSRSPERAAPLVKMGASIVPGDVTDLDSVKVDLSSFDAVIHSAALVKTMSKDPSDFDRVNVLAVASLAKRALEARVPRFIYTSSFMALGPAPAGDAPLDESASHDPAHLHNDYERTKYLGLVEFDSWVARGLPGIVLFPCVIYGPGALTSGNVTASSIADLILGRLPGLLGDGTCVWTYSYIADVVAGHLAALEKGAPGERYILGGDSASMEEFVKIVSTLADVPMPKRHIPYWLAKVAALPEEIRFHLSGREPKLTRQTVEIYKHHWAYSCEKARRDLGYTVTPLADALGATVDWIKTEIKAGRIK